MRSIYGPILSALKSAMLRRRGLIAKTVFTEMVFATQEDVEAFLALARMADGISFQRLVVFTLIPHNHPHHKGRSPEKKLLFFWIMTK